MPLKTATYSEKWICHTPSTSLTPICHCSRDRSISLTPITNPSQLQTTANPVPSQIYPMILHFSLWPWFRREATANAASKGSSSPPEASSTKASGLSSCIWATSAAIPASLLETSNLSPAGRMARSNRALATLIPT